MKKSIQASRWLTMVLPVFVFAAFLAILLARTTGIHVDENDYLDLSVNQLWGDTSASGKPPLFYWSNYFYYHLIGQHLGFLAPISIYLFYIFVFSLALIFWLKTVAKNYSLTIRHQTLLLAAVMSSPLIILNMTQLMMETPIFICFWMALAFWTRLFNPSSLWPSFSKNPKSTQSIFGLCFFIALSIMIKPTAVFAWTALAVSHGIQSMRIKKLKSTEKTWMPLFIMGSAIAGYVFFKLQLKLTHVFASTSSYAGLDSLLKNDAYLTRLSWTGSYFYTWWFFSGLPILLASYAFWVFLRSKKSDSKDPVAYPFYLLLALTCALSLPFFHLLQISSTHEYVRYGYPLLLLGLIFSYLALIQLRPLLLIPLIIFQLWDSSSMIRTDPGRFSAWPKSVVEEHFESGGTQLKDIRTYFWTTRMLMHQSHSPCIWIQTHLAERANKALQFFTFVFPRATFIRGTKSEFSEQIRSERCSVSPLIIYENTHDLGSSTTDCMKDCGSNHEQRFPSLASCTRHKISFFGELPGDVLQNLCWYEQ